MRPARSPLRKRPPPSKDAPPPAELSVLDSIRLVLCLVAMTIVRLGTFRIFRGGARVTASDLLTIPDWKGKTFTTINKQILREYRTRNAGDSKTIAECWGCDRYYIQAGVKSDTPVEASPLLAMLMARHWILRITVFVLQTFFTIQTVSLWVNGHGPATTETHFDSDHNLVIVLHGACTFHTAPRSAFAPGGPGCRENESTNSPRNSDLFTARPMIAGMMAIQPGHMWHYVESSPHSVKLAIFFR
jgi:hypothetical protein